MSLRQHIAKELPAVRISRNSFIYVNHSFNEFVTTSYVNNFNDERTQNEENARYLFQQCCKETRNVKT